MRFRQTITLARAASLLLVALFLAACGSVGSAGDRSANSEAAAGERIYRKGIDVTGMPLQAFSQTDVPLGGAQAACVSCHRPSGLGSSEGGYYVPPINGPLLFAPRQLDRRRLFPDFYHQVQPERFKVRLHQPHMRPAYTLDTLAVALRTGKDPAGQQLATIMPRYRLSDADVMALDAYLHTLSAHTDPGVDAQQIRLATVFSDKVPAAEREAVLSTLRAYVDWHNLHLNEDLSRRGFSPYNRSDFVPIERRWTLSVWELKGDESTWRGQLEAQYRNQPVFALISGKVQGSWSGPSQFCDAYRLPCLFPDTDLPAWPASPRGYTAYFSAGLVLEAQVAARFITEEGTDHSVLQVAASDSFGEVPSQAFARELHALRPDLHPRTTVFRDESQLTATLNSIGRDSKPTLVIWPGADARIAINALAATHMRAALIVLPSRAIEAARSLALGDLAGRLRFVDPYELKMSSHAKSFETRAWMHTRKLALDHIVLRFKAYYAASLLDAALFEISNDFYRDYLLERVEDESQKDLNPGMYPRLALAPGERDAAKVAEVVRLDPRQSGGLVSVSEWIAP